MQEKIRNFCIISHIDHGKSTLADRFLELTQTIEKRKMREQFLDQMDLEREKGITIKMQPVRMEYQGYVLNLIDTPGHVDFSYEVSRALAAVEGAILLVDATKGIQAQTLANLNLAQKQELVLIPAVNKIDSPLAKTEEVAKELALLLNIKREEVFLISAKEGTNIPSLLKAVIERIPCPKGNKDGPLRALIFDSLYDSFKGIVVYVRIVDGEVKENDRIFLLATQRQGTGKELGYFVPDQVSQPVLQTGEIGYIATGLKEAQEVLIGDTIASAKTGILPLPGYEIPKPMVFLSMYPQDINDFDALKTGLEQLKLNDPSFVFAQESKEALGRGFSCGFLGVLHSEIIAERVHREFGIELVISRPSVEFQITTQRGKRVCVKTPSDWPEEKILEVKEPWARLEVLTPSEFFSKVSQLLLSLDGKQKEVNALREDRVLLRYEIPLRQVIGDLYERLKSISSGMASMDYEVLDWRRGDLVRLEIWVAKEPEEALSVIVPRDKAYKEGKAILEKLKESLPPQLFEVALQAVIESRVVARETMRAQRRDVTAPLYGGDVTRKRKLLEKQKKGKRELKEKGRVLIPSRVFLDLFRS